MASLKPLEIDMIAGSQLRDTQGEMLSVEGADITDLELGRGRFNDNHGKGFFNSVGRVTEAKKIFSEDDCENERHRLANLRCSSPCRRQPEILPTGDISYCAQRAVDSTMVCWRYGAIAHRWYA